MASVAVVARTRLEGLEFLVETKGAAEWAVNEQVAAKFETLREATRAAMRPICARGSRARVTPSTAAAHCAVSTSSWSSRGHQIRGRTRATPLDKEEPGTPLL